MKAVFDDRSPAWTPNFECNTMFVLQQQNYMNDKLKAVGYMTILDVFYHLGLPVELARFKGKIFEKLCWVYENGAYIDFGMKPDAEKNIIYLDFNIDID